MIKILFRAYIKSINNRRYKNNLTQKLADKGYTADRFKFGEKALDIKLTDKM